MDTDSSFQPVSIYADNSLSVPFLIDWILAVILCILVPFYFGRIFAWIITKLLNLWVWRRHKIKITLQSVKISFLGGRVFFKNLTVITEDYTVSFLEGSFTWRYWLLHVRPSELELTEEKSDIEELTKSRARFLLKCDGFEVFVYNRLDTYESIFQEHFTDPHKSDPTSKSSENEEATFSSSSLSQQSTQASGKMKTGSKLPLYTKIFPIGIEINKGAVVLGNRNTQKVGISCFENGKGSIDIASPGSDLDVFKKKISFDMRDCVFEIKNNLGYLNDEPVKSFVVERKLKQIFNRLRLFCMKLIDFILEKNQIFGENDSYLESWRGLDIYQRTKDDTLFDDKRNIENLNNLEYARYSTIMKSERITVTYSYDVPGVVPEKESFIDQSFSNICGSDPEFGVEISLWSATIYYGPWAHKYIRALQQLFSPVVSRSSSIRKIPKTGDRRDFAAFSLTILIIENSMLHIPIRERSKDFAFLKHYGETGNEQRPFGWLNISLNQDSELFFRTNFFAFNDKISNELTLKLAHPEVKSSVNHDILFKAKKQILNADLSYPVGWNDVATWNFNFLSENAQLFILRDHVTLVSDLFTDFTSIQDVDYELFRPFHYNINWEIKNYKIFLTVNDANIINNPIDFGENCYICMSGEDLKVEYKLPATTIAKDYQLFEFELSSPCTKLYLYPPSWNTLHEFMKELEIGRLSDFQLVGTYTSYDTVDIDNMDSITLEFKSSSTTLVAFGFVLRYFMNVKHNYFGDFKHFKTTEEYTNDIKLKKDESANNLNPADDPSVEDTASTISDFSLEHDETELLDPNIIQPSSLRRIVNETDIWITFCTDRGCIAIPQNIYNAKSSLLFLFDRFTFDTRYTNYYMDLSASFPPTYVKESQNFHIESFNTEGAYRLHTNAILLDLCIHAHRMFGLPPSEDTFFCKWDISLSEIEINANIKFFFSLIQAFTKIGFTYMDSENILIYEIQKVNDITSLSVAVGKVLISIADDFTDGSLRLDLNNMTMNILDLATEKYSKRLDMKVPEVDVAILSDADNILSGITTSLDLTNFVINKNAKTHKENQRRTVLLNDAPLHRCTFLLPVHYRKFPCYQILYATIIPSISLPTLYEPLTTLTFDSTYEDLLGRFSEDLRFDTDTENYSSLANGSEPTGTLQSSQGEFSFGVGVEEKKESIEYNNLVLSVGPTLVRLTPDSATLLLNLVQEIGEVSIEDTLDMYEMDVVEKFSQYFSNESFEVNLSLFTTRIEIEVGKAYGPGGAFSDQAHLSALFSNLSFYLRHQKYCNSFGIDNAASTYEKETIAALRILGFEMELFKENQGLLVQQMPFAKISLFGVHSTLCSNMEKASSLSANKATISIDENELDLILNYMQELLAPISKLHESIMGRRDFIARKSKELLFRIAKGGRSYNVNHVPPVITKPAYITRLSVNHVRENQSWRVITRLRHALNYFPDVWFKETKNQIEEHCFTEESKMVEEIRQIFSDWKSWEVSDVENCYFYKDAILGNKMKSAPFFYEETKVLLGALKLEIISSSPSIFSAINMELGMKYLSSDAILDFDALGEGKSELDVKISADSMIGSLDKSVIIALCKAGGGSDKASTALEVPSINLLGLHFKHLSLGLTASNLALNLLLRDVSISALQTNSSDDCLSSIVFGIEDISVQLYHSERLFLNLSSKYINGSYQKLLSCSLEFFTTVIKDIYCETSNCNLRHLRDIIEDIIRLSDALKPIYSELQAKSILKNQHDRTNKQRNITLLLSSFRFRTALFFPYLLQLTVTDIKAVLQLSYTREISFQIGNMSFEILRQKDSLLKFFIIRTSVIYFEEQSRTLNVEVDSCKLSIFDFKPHFQQICEDVGQITKDLDVLTNLLKVNMILPKDGDNYKSWSISLLFSYFGFLMQLGSSRYILELATLAASVTKAENAKDIPNILEITGSASVSNILFLITDSTIPLDLSKVVDVGLSIKISGESGKRSLELESSHARICFSPHTLVKVLSLVNEIKIVQNHVAANLPASTVIKATDVGFGAKWDSIHILSHDFCVGWIFGAKCSAPGLVLGFGSLFGAYEHPFGKITLVDGFLSTAVGNSSESFYLLNTKIPEHNRSHLPSMQLSCWFEETQEERDLFIKMNASQLDIKLLTNFVDIAKGFLKSIDLMEDLRTGMAKATQTEPAQKRSVYTLPSFITGLREVNCVINYGGGIIKLFTPEDLIDGHVPSFQLTSPMIKVSVQYIHTSSIERVHWIRGSIDVESTHNTIFPSCVPILFSLKRDIKALMKSISLQRKTTSPSSRRNSGGDTSIMHPSFDYNNLLDSFDIAFVINIGNQNVTLTCEPMAKIQADIGYNNFKICLFTNNAENSKPLSLALTLSGLEISSRHIFSREISGSATINSMDINLMVTHDNCIKTFGNTVFSGIRIYLNLKQMQDINLLLDIWSYKENSSDTYKMNSSKYLELPIPGTHKPVKLNSIPWVHQLVLKNISAKIDMGPSLGILTICTPLIWAISNHDINWTHSLNFYLQEFQAVSEGRLGIKFVLEKTFFESAIQWPIKDSCYDVPIINLSLNIERVSSKISFDYHSFLVGRISEIVFSACNERDSTGFLKDLLRMSVSCGSVEIFLTALASANLYDIYDTFSRMKSENQETYEQILKDSNPESSGRVENESNDIMEPLNLRTKLAGKIESFRIHLYPSTLFDREVLVLTATKTSVDAVTQTELKTKTDLSWQIHDIDASLAHFKSDITEESFVGMTMEQYIEKASEVSGGIILSAPSIFVAITTWQKIPDNIVELLYSSSFGGKVDIKWNLDPINFIREMWAVHVRALSVRRAQEGVQSSKKFFEDENIEDKIKIVNLGTKYKYVPLEEPHIEMPLLKDLGDATPPIEWFGVNRKRFPGMTHQIIVIPLQKFILAAEKKYNKKLDKI